MRLSVEVTHWQKLSQLLRRPLRIAVVMEGKENGLAARSGPSTVRTGRRATTGRNQTSNPFNKLQAPFPFFAIKI